jgi:hypothetical protein
VVEFKHKIHKVVYENKSNSDIFNSREGSS